MAMGIAVSSVPAYIQVLPPGVGIVVFPFNPDEYTIEKSSLWKANAQPAAAAGGKPQFQGVKAPTVHVKILLDAFAVPPTPPEPMIEILHQAMAPSDASLAQGDAKAPMVMFGWGTNIVMEQAYLKSMSVTYKRFLLGNPVRAEVTVGLEAVPEVVPGTNPTSGGIATKRTHMMTEGDTLASVSQREYGDPTKWRALALANGIDDPMRVRDGTILMVPDLNEVDSLS
jgi:nucleoid-associated protein YgaU